MPVTLKTLLTKLLFWLAAEIVLTLVGLDNLADYSEFIANQTSGSGPNGTVNSNVALVSLHSA
ncbi:MAG: hypothetical protein WBB01_16695 [Phormidesmis sp.]